jgi:hypothetical protein
MALTITRVPDGNDVWGRTRIEYRDITLDTSYPTGGYNIRASDVGLSNIFGATLVSTSEGRLLTTFNKVVGEATFAGSITMRINYPTGGATAAPASLSDPIVTSGGATATAVNAATPNITPGWGKAVATGTDLSSVTIRVRFEGR